MRNFAFAVLIAFTAGPAFSQTAQPVVPPSSQGMMPNSAPAALPAAGTGMNPTATGQPIIPTTRATPDCNQVTNGQGNPAPAHALACNTETNPPLRTVTPPHQ